jgi:heme-degrading monooxygenase HmoA
MSTFVYLRLSSSAEDETDFEADMREMDELSGQQPGYIWSEILTVQGSVPTWVVLSEWESREHSRAWEHSDRHEEIMDKWEKRYASPYVKRRFTSE